MALLIPFIAFVGIVGVSATNTDQAEGPKQGWTTQPDGRGTIDIIWSCVLTMGICSWSIICMNTPGANETKWLVLWRKFALSALGVVAPELLVSMAASQWIGAQRCVKDFAKLTSTDQPTNGLVDDTTANAGKPILDKDNEKEVIDMPKAFYIDMGGFRIKPKHAESFPTNGRDMYWLVKEGLVKQPLFKSSMIEEKNKVDPLLRTLTLLQISYFLVQVIGRWAQHLFVTTAELTTIAFIVCSILGSVFWWHKPCDVIAPETIIVDLTVEEIIAKGAPPNYRWFVTPLDFASREEWWWSRVWWNFLNILKGWGILFGSEAPNGKAIDRIADSVQRPLPRVQQYMILGVTTLCFGVFFIAWNHAFPTRVEQTMWRIVCGVQMGFLFVGLAISEALQAYPTIKKPIMTWHSNRSPTLPLSQQTRQPSYNRLLLCRIPRIQASINKINIAFDKIRNNSPNNDPNLELPLRVVLPFYAFGFLYWLCRGYILIEDAIGLREQPASAYATVNWQKFWPHFG